MSRNIAIVLAGGTSKRFGGELPKQLVVLDDGLSVLEHSVAAFVRNENIDEVVVVMNVEYMDVATKIFSSPEWQKKIQIVSGGDERWQSSYNAIEQIKKCNVETDNTNVLFHDAARPFVSQRIISDVCQALESHEAVSVAVPLTDTLYEVNKGKIMDIPNRSLYRRAQTPQGFHFQVIDRAYQQAIKSRDVIATDDCGILHNYMPDVPIYIVEGEEDNRKITYRTDV